MNLSGSSLTRVNKNLQICTQMFDCFWGVLTQKKQKKNQSLHQNRQIGIGFFGFFFWFFLNFQIGIGFFFCFFLVFFGFFGIGFGQNSKLETGFFWFFLGFLVFFLIFLA